MTITAPTEQRLSAVVDSPVGPLVLTAAGGALVALSMCDEAPTGMGSARDAGGVLADAAAQLTEYFAGERTDFDLPLRPNGSAFHRTVWAALLDIPYGRTESYGDLAARVGRPGAARAVGLANGRNPIGIVVPCHRVVGARGDLTGYAAGLDRKRFLLTLEQRVSGAALPLD